MGNLVSRILTSIILLPVVIAVFMSGGVYLTALLALAGFLCAKEIANVIMPHSRRALILSAIFFASFFAPFVFVKPWPVALVLLFVAAFIFNAVVLFIPKITMQEFANLSAIFYWCFYVTFGILCIQWLVNRPLGFDERTGLSFVFLACLSTWGNDTFAYFGGRLFGKHPLYSAVSAKKTWEGFVSGALFSVLLVVGLDMGGRAFGVAIFSGLSLGDLLWVVVPATILAPVGDLIESRLKRLYDTKDSSNILPGHGGLLDRIDGLLTVLPWTALYAFILRPIW